MSMADFLIKQKDNDDKGVMFVLAENRRIMLTYKELYQHSLTLLSYLNEQGIKTGDAIVLSLNNKDKFTIAFWACALGGIRSIPSNENIQNISSFQSFFPRDDQPYYLMESDQRPVIAELFDTEDQDRLLTYPEDRELSSRPAQGAVVPMGPNDVATILFSSGSISEPKGIPLTNRVLDNYIDMLVKTFDFQPSDSMLGWLPLNHNTSLILFHLYPVFLGMDQVHMQAHLVMRDIRFLFQMATELHTTISGTISSQLGQAAQVAQTSPSLEWDLHSIHTFFVGAEPVTPKACMDFNREMKRYGLRECVVRPAYGLTETTSLITVHEKGSDIACLNIDGEYLSMGHTVRFVETTSPHSRVFTSVGVPISGAEIAISSPEGEFYREDVIGIVRIKSPSLVESYYGSQQPLAEDGWLDTGDIGLIHDGRLYIVGRYKDMFIINGKNYYCNDVENELVLKLSLNNNEIAIAAISDGSREISETLVCFLKHSGEIDASFIDLSVQIWEYCTAHYGISIEAFVALEDFPKTTSGKVRRQHMKEGYLRGEKGYRCFYCMKQDAHDAMSDTSEEIAQKLQEIFEKDIHKSIDEYECYLNYIEDSLSISRIHLIIDQLYPDTLEVTDLFKYSSIQELSQYISKTLQRVG
ncbi:MAG: AMP-binding protein [Clostridiales bacterium]|nr:AMP-binding protein [Clostridiales bacterium]